MAFLTTGTVGPGYCSTTDTFVSLVPTGGGPPIGGSGTAGYLPYFSGSTLGNSLLRQAGGNLFMPTSGSVAIGLDIDTPPTGILELVSSTKGFVPPKVTTTQRDAMSPLSGWSIYNTTTNQPNYYNGSAWTTYGISGSGTTNQIPLWTGTSALGNSLLNQGTNLVEQKSGTTAQTLRIFRDSRTTYTTNGRVALVLGDLSGEGITGFGSMTSTYGALAPAHNYVFGMRDGAPVDRLWQVDATAGSLIAPSGATIGANLVSESSLYPNSIAALYVSATGRIWLGNEHGRQMAGYSLSGDETGYGIQLGRAAANEVVSGPKVGIKGEDCHDTGDGAINNAPGGSIEVAPSRGTGTAKPGYSMLKGGAMRGESGTTRHVNVQRILSGLTKSGLTAGSANTLFMINLPSGSRAGGSVEFTLESTDGTEHQVDTGSFRFDAYNKAGTITSACSGTIIGELGLASLGTLTAACSVTNDAAGGLNLAGSITINITPTVSVIIPTTLRITYTLFNHSQQAVHQIF